MKNEQNFVKQLNQEIKNLQNIITNQSFGIDLRILATNTLSAFQVQASQIDNEYHIYDQRCPDCSAFCTLKIGHAGKHQPNLHRIKEQQIFALKDSDQEILQISEEGQTRQYYIGEICEPETCMISCSRRSRAHYHLLEYKGGKECAELLLKEIGIVAKYQTTKYKGSDKIYDEILCEAYWDYK